MIFKNRVTHNRELEGDLLRQRRNLYATSLALIVYQAAGGHLQNAGAFAAVHIQFARPTLLFWFAVCALTYFLYRYWVVEPGCFGRFGEEWEWQWRATKLYRDISLNYVIPRIHKDETNSAIYWHKQGWVTAFHFRTGTGYAAGNITLYAPNTDKTKMFNRSQNPPSSDTLGFKQQRKLRIARWQGFFRAVALERTVSDLMLPYLIGCIALTVSILAGP